MEKSVAVALVVVVAVVGVLALVAFPGEPEQVSGPQPVAGKVFPAAELAHGGQQDRPGVWATTESGYLELSTGFSRQHRFLVFSAWADEAAVPETMTYKFDLLGFSAAELRSEALEAESLPVPLLVTTKVAGSDGIERNGRREFSSIETYQNFIRVLGEPVKKDQMPEPLADAELYVDVLEVKEQAGYLGVKVRYDSGWPVVAVFANGQLISIVPINSAVERVYVVEIPAGIVQQGSATFRLAVFNMFDGSFFEPPLDGADNNLYIRDVGVTASPLLY